MDLKRAIVVVTGASAGVGRATARAFASRGVDVALLARGTEGLEAARSEVEAQGSRALAIPTDVADPAQVDDAAATVEERLGPIDLWVNNAMVSVFAPFVQIDPQDFARVTEVTYLGYVNGTRAALKWMRPRDRGKVIQVGSALAYRGIPLQSAYCGAKHAIEGFTESVRTELLHEKSAVRLTIVQMPALNTPQFEWVKTTLPNHPQPVPPIWQPELAADAVVWAAEHDRREIKLAWSSTATVFANKIAPGLLDRYLARTGFAGQQTDHPVEPDRQVNLWAPVNADFGARGRFDARARRRSPHWWLNKNWRFMASVGAMGAGMVLWWTRR